MAIRKMTKTKKAATSSTAVKTRKAKSAPAAKSGPVDLERIVEMDFVRTLENAALNAYRWLGKGDSQAAHRAAVDAIRGMMDLTRISATVLFGDGRRPQPQGIEPGEKLGTWEKDSLEIDMAMVPIDGIDLVARGFWGAISVLVASRRVNGRSALMDFPCRYTEKISYGPAVAKGPERVHLNASVRDNLEIIAMKLGKRVQDINVAVLDRKRHERLIRDIRKAGASVRLFSDGDIALCMAPSIPNTGFDVYMGIGGALEATIAAAAVKCLGGDMLVRMAPMDDTEKKNISQRLSEDAIDKHYCAEDLARGDGIIFCATGITDGSVMSGVHVRGNSASTSSVMMRSKYKTVRRIKSEHDLSRKTIRLRSADAETAL